MFLSISKLKEGQLDNSNGPKIKTCSSHQWMQSYKAPAQEPIDGLLDRLTPAHNLKNGS
jgi:hypothetical protein